MTLKGSGFLFLDKINEVMISINKYKPLGGLSYFPLPLCIENKRATINVRNDDEKCFVFSIFPKLVDLQNSFRIGRNYHDLVHNYNFIYLLIL